MIKICSKCGKEFETKTCTKVCDMCKTRVCPNCNNRFKVNNSSSKQVCCSIKCANEYAKKTGAIKQQLEATKKTNLEKYGKEWFSQTQEYLDKSRKTYQRNYGVDHPMKSDIVKQQCIETNIKEHGYKNPFEDKEVRRRLDETMLRKYGVKHYAQTEDYKEMRKQQVQEKYGKDSYFQTDDFKEKREQTELKKYGKENYAQTEAFKKLKREQNIKGYIDTKTNEQKRVAYIAFINNPKQFIENNFKEKPTRHELANIVGVNPTCIDEYIKKNDINDLINYYQSTLEIEVKEFLLDVLPDSEIIEHDRKVIAPQELDFYLPEYKLAIECNPTYTHNSSICTFGSNNNVKPKTYHQSKSLKCKEKGILLFHIFGYEWTARQEIIKSMLRNLLCANDRVIYARNTYIVEITQKEADEFLNENHRQGTVTARIRLGLKEKNTDELVSIMTFGGIRGTMGDRNADKGKNILELSRFCSLLNTTVVGGASKLFKYFIGHYEYDKVVSFSDIAHTKGELYKRLGFKEISLSTPSYVWVDQTTNLYFHRVRCQKRKLPKLFNDESIDTENQTEAEIMESHGYVKVYDSGVVRWEYTKD